MKYQWILFDADGTLFDYDRAEATALEQAFKDLVDAPFIPDYLPTYTAINKQLWLAFEKGTVTALQLRTRRFEQLFAELQMTVDAAAFSTRYLHHLSHSTTLIEGAQEMLEALRPYFRMALITNGLREVQRSRFERSAIGSYFAEIIVSDEVGAAKPDPAIFDFAFQKMGNPDKGSVLIVGDSITSDIEGGIRYGIDTCWFNPHQLARPEALPITYEIRRLAELPGLLV